MKSKYTDLITSLSDDELRKHLYLTQVILLSIFFILGLFLFDSFQQFRQLIQWNEPFELIVGSLVGGIVVIIDIMLMKWLPSSFYDDGGINEKIFSNRRVKEVAVIAAVVAISEELLFRGILQTHFGLILSSFIFSIIHYRYLFNWFLFLNITTLSFLIGYVYQLTDHNLLVTIIMHFTIDFLLGICISKKRK